MGPDHVIWGPIVKRNIFQGIDATTWSDHVIWRPMRGLKKVKHRQANLRTDIATTRPKWPKGQFGENPEYEEEEEEKEHHHYHQTRVPKGMQVVKKEWKSMKKKKIPHTSSSTSTALQPRWEPMTVLGGGVLHSNLTSTSPNHFHLGLYLFLAPCPVKWQQAIPCTSPALMFALGNEYNCISRNYDFCKIFLKTYQLCTYFTIEIKILILLKLSTLIQLYSLKTDILVTKSSASPNLAYILIIKKKQFFFFWFSPSKSGHLSFS